ncbi:MAG: hypothetical protein R3Y07_00360 [Eubacteriales bacterium]
MITDKVIEDVKNIDVVAFIGRYYGFSFKESGSGYRCNEHGSLAVATDCRG